MNETAARAWSLTQLRHAAELGYGTTRTGTPRVAEVAQAAGVSARTVRRWFAGQSMPTAEHAAALRAALAPDQDVLLRQEYEARTARSAIPALKARRARRATAAWRAQGWDQPHQLFIVANSELGISRPLMAAVHRVKPVPLPRSWQRLDVVELPTRPAAVVTRYELLQHVQAWRVRVRPELTEASSMCWLTHEPLPLLSTIAHAVGVR